MDDSITDGVLSLRFSVETPVTGSWSPRVYMEPRGLRVGAVLPGSQMSSAAQTATEHARETRAGVASRRYRSAKCRSQRSFSSASTSLRRSDAREGQAHWGHVNAHQRNSCHGSLQTNVSW